MVGTKVDLKLALVCIKKLIFLILKFSSMQYFIFFFLSRKEFLWGRDIGKPLSADDFFMKQH